MPVEESPSGDSTPLTHAKKKLVEARLMSENYEMLAKDLPPTPPCLPGTRAESKEQLDEDCGAGCDDDGDDLDDDYVGGDDDGGGSDLDADLAALAPSSLSSMRQVGSAGSGPSSSLASDLSTLSIAYSLGMSADQQASQPSSSLANLLTDMDDAMSSLDAWKAARAKQLDDLLSEYPLSPSPCDDSSPPPSPLSSPQSSSPLASSPRSAPSAYSQLLSSSRQVSSVPSALSLPPLSAGVQALLDGGDAKLERCRLDLQATELLRSAAAPLSSRGGFDKAGYYSHARPDHEEKSKSGGGGGGDDDDDAAYEEGDKETDDDLRECRERLSRNKARMRELTMDLEDMERQACDFEIAMGTDVYLMERGGALDDVLKRLDELEGRRGSDREESKENPQGH